MRVEPDHGQPVLACGQTFDGADVRATAAAEDDRPLRKIRGERERLLLERLGLDDRGLGVGQLEPRRLRHRFTSLTPGLRNPDQPCEVDAAARMALVLWSERDRGEGLAVGTLRAQAAHASSVSNATASYAMSMPARS